MIEFFEKTKSRCKTSIRSSWAQIAQNIKYITV